MTASAIASSVAPFPSAATTTAPPDPVIARLEQMLAARLETLASRTHERAEAFWVRIPASADPATGRMAQSGSLGADGPCWFWEGFRRAQDGTGILSWNHKHALAHRKAWELYFRKPLPPGARLIRLCNSPACCNVRDHYTLKLPAPPRLLDSQLFREELAEAIAEEPYCREGHALKPGQKRWKCPECLRERRLARLAERQTLTQTIAAAHYLDPSLPRPTPPEEEDSAPEDLADYFSVSANYSHAADLQALCERSLTGLMSNGSGD